MFPPRPVLVVKMSSFSAFLKPPSASSLSADPSESLAGVTLSPLLEAPPTTAVWRIVLTAEGKDWIISSKVRGARGGKG